MSESKKPTLRDMFGTVPDLIPNPVSSEAWVRRFRDGHDAGYEAGRADERARCVAERVKVANGLKAIRELARQVAEFYPEASERIKEAGICIVDEAEHLAALTGADK